MAASERTPAVGMPLNYYQPDGSKRRFVSDQSGWLPGAICPACKTPSMYAVQAFRSHLASLAGAQVKAAVELGVQLICRNPDCDLPDSRVVTERHHRSYD